MDFSQRKTPARLASPAARKLPRKFLFWFMLAYIVAGLFGRNPWKTDDIAGMAAMVAAADQGNWATSYISMIPNTEHGPLTSIIGGIFITIFAPLFEFFSSPIEAQILASRLPNFLYFFGMLWGVWYGTYVLARRDEAQPLPLPFGGEPNPRDYGRMIADVAFFFMLAAVGIVIRTHETSFYPLLMCIHAIAFYGFAQLLNHPTQGSLVIGTMMSAAFMTRGFVGLTPLLIATLALFVGRVYTFRLKVFLFISLVLAVLLSVVWIASAHDLDPGWVNIWWSEQLQSFALPSITDTLTNIRNLAWFLWPTWPFALLALWNWRKWFDAPHIFIPACLVLANLLLILFKFDAFEAEYGPLTIATAVLAAMSMPTLKRSVINLLDWYSIMVVSLGLLTIWVGWSALYVGIPPQIHHNIMRLIPGFEPTISWIAVAAGVVVCFFWYKIAAWRLTANPKARWRGIILSAAGTILSWLLLSLLWLPAIDYNRSYRDVGESLAQALEDINPDYKCITTVSMGQGQSAAFAVFGHIRLSELNHCPYSLLQTRIDSAGNLGSAYKGKILWQGQRRSERHGEIFLLLANDDDSAFSAKPSPSHK